MNMSRAPLALTMGDPAGIGPEISEKAWCALHQTDPCFFLIGDPSVLKGPYRLIDDPNQAKGAFHDALPVLAFPSSSPVKAGVADPAHASMILGAIERAVALVRDGRASGVVTNPISKAPLYAAGFVFPGHTEFLGALTDDLCGPAPRPPHRDGPLMMLAVEGLRVALATVHIPLNAVSAALSVAGIVRTGLVLNAALQRDFAITSPRIVVAGLNPHAGESGTIGREEEDIVRPAVQELRALGVHAIGPTPADSLFHGDARATYDAALCLYHDQALIPIKTLDFWGGVNITLGLPIVRTSPDHGTGFDIAGRGIARTDSLVAAIRAANMIVGNRAKLPA